jgi:UPF0716 protein FxsA
MTAIVWIALSLLLLIETLLLSVLARSLGNLSLFLLSGVTAGAGLWLMRGEDFSLWTLVETELQQRRLPTTELWDALVLWLAGGLLVVPGLLSDAIGIVLTLPDIRSTLVERLEHYFRQRWRAPL